MPSSHPAIRTEIVIRAWREGETGGDEAYRGSISTLSGSRTRHFIGLKQLMSRLTEMLQGSLNSTEGS